VRPTRRLLAAVTTLAATAALCLPAGVSDAATPAPNAMSAGRLGEIALSDAGSFARGYRERASVESSRPGLRVVSIDEVLATGATGAAGARTRPACHESDLHVGTTWRGLCWSESDDRTARWYPQGITGSGDAANGSPYFVRCAGCPAHKVVAVSWHNRDNSLARISFLDVTSGLAGAPYNNAILVAPDGGGDGFNRVRSHADGIAWYGRLIFLVSSSRALVQVFDLRHIWAMSDTTSRAVGCSATGACSAARAAYALPRVGYYHYPGGRSCASRFGARPCFSSVSLDRSSTPDSLVTTEYSERAGGRVLRWPLDVRTGRLSVGRDKRAHPTAGWKAPVRRMQGAAFAARHGVVAGLCPPGAPAVSYMPGSGAAVHGLQAKACLYHATRSSLRPGATLSLRYWTTAPSNMQNVSYWPASGEIWTLNEFRGNGVFDGDRLVLALDCPALVCR
jgi:hypothetical protein